MTDNPPGYELADRMALTEPGQVKAIGHPLRTTILQLLHERAATVTELAGAVGRPKSTVAHHVDVLARNGLLQVVATRKVRAIEERFYGRTARLFYVAAEPSPAGGEATGDFNDFEVAARESAPAFAEGELWGFIRHARISRDQASEFWARMAELVGAFDRLPRSGETTYGFAIGIYPTDHPALPPAELGVEGDVGVGDPAALDAVPEVVAADLGALGLLQHIDRGVALGEAADDVVLGART
ncbi:ArsR/SmtB family transcription factor [Actinorhabdospora filicis]|uniref:ArsR/SmtB family transcription factor n=1 Tax=Actinorhabdospora filicis TaxID=1785913 RepID=UPI002554BDAD|nr:winged helix-turn-helix domain-containing protein [Actinorhabdospora filicis]